MPQGAGGGSYHLRGQRGGGKELMLQNSGLDGAVKITTVVS